MKVGEKVDCPHCGETCIAKKETLMDGWTKVGDILVCSFCSKKLADYEPEIHAKEENKSSQALASFLGVEQEDKPKIQADGDNRFCRDCSHYVAHPFMNRCSLHQKEVDPMDDCDDFKPKE